MPLLRLPGQLAPSNDWRWSEVLIASDYPFVDIMWTMLVFFGWVIWISLVIMILIDNFRRPDTSGVAKAVWLLFVIFVPLVGVLAYIIVRPRDVGPVAT
jgi:hypothetical protein